MNDDLKELYETGKNRRYRMVEKIPELREGFVHRLIFKEVEDTHYGNKK